MMTQQNDFMQPRVSLYFIWPFGITLTSSLHYAVTFRDTLSGAMRKDVLAISMSSGRKPTARQFKPSPRSASSHFRKRV